MSLVGSQVYANSSKSCWVSVNGGDTVNGNLTVTGNLQVDGTTQVSSLSASSNIVGLSVTSQGALTGQQVVFTGPSSAPTTGSIFTNGATPTTMTLQGASFNFSRGSITPPTTTLVLDNAPPLGPGDALTVGGSVSMTKLLAGGNMVGTGSISVGNSSTGIATANVTAASKIFLSRIGPASAGPAKGAAQGILTYDPADILPGLSFTVRLVDIDGVTTTATDVNAQFIWMVVN